MLCRAGSPNVRNTSDFVNPFLSCFFTRKLRISVSEKYWQTDFRFDARLDVDVRFDAVVEEGLKSAMCLSVVMFV